jgi:6-pyruvoyltetrahydropterin/6-carboxytetrahydropterin synthase
MTEIWVDVSFDAAHYLPNVPDGHKCGQMHGHTYHVRLYVSGKVDEHTGWIVDYADVKAAWAELDAELDHRVLNDIIGNPTCENIAEWIADQLTLPPNCWLGRVDIQETKTAGCVYTVR